MSNFHHRETEAYRKTDIADRLICVGGVNHHDFDGSGSLCAIAQTKRNYPIILEVWD
jgi:hypothetical protein